MRNGVYDLEMFDARYLKSNLVMNLQYVPSVVSFPQHLVRLNG